VVDEVYTYQIPTTLKIKIGAFLNSV